MKKLLTVLGLVLIAIVGVVLYNTFTFSSKQIKANPNEIVQAPYDSAAVHRLAHALRFKTISYDE
ncbi:MAG: hypothetical protein NZ522_08890, partial [Chitinophagales bacterium]|nr:hypothetical protein [Chitinophagales bacterium]